MFINYVLGLAYVIVTFLIYKSYSKHTKILEQQLINQREQNEIMKAQTTALQLQVKNLETQNKLLEKQLKLSAMEKLHFLEKIRDQQRERYERWKMMADPKTKALLDRSMEQLLEPIAQEIEGVKKIQRELSE